MIGAHARKRSWYYGGMALTFVLGAVFLVLEIHEFRAFIAEGAGPSRSAFLSSFFALVGCHGLHVAAGLLLLLTMVAQSLANGFREDIQRRLLCFSLIIWVALFSLVYLEGVATQ